MLFPKKKQASLMWVNTCVLDDVSKHAEVQVSGGRRLPCTATS